MNYHLFLKKICHIDDEMVLLVLCNHRGVNLHDPMPLRWDTELLLLCGYNYQLWSTTYPWIGQTIPSIHSNHRLRQTDNNEHNDLLARRLSSNWFSYQIKKILPETCEQLNLLSLHDRLTKFQPVIQLFYDHIGDFLRLSPETQDAFFRKTVEILQRCSSTSHPIYHVCEHLIDAYLTHTDLGTATVTRPVGHVYVDGQNKSYCS